MKFEDHRTTAIAGTALVVTAVDEGIGVLRPTDALSRRPGASLGFASTTRLRSRSRTFFQPMGSSIDSARSRRR